MKLLYCDLETFCETPINFGSHKYAENAGVLLWGYAIDDAPAKVWDRTVDRAMPDDLKAALDEVMHGNAMTVWHNGMMFDTIVLKHSLGIILPIERTIDTMVLAYEHGLPGSLGALSEVLRLPQDKARDKDGARLVQLFCKPLPATRKIARADRHTHPEDWSRFVNYCRLDVEAEREVFKKLPKFNITPYEREIQRVDALINRRGMLMDVDLAKGAIRLSEKIKERLDSTVYYRTSGAVDAATQRDKLIAFIKETYGWELKDMTKAEIEKRLDDPDVPEPVKDLLMLRLLSSRNSVKKYESVLNCVSSDNRLRGTIQFRGAARTGRFCLTGDHEVLTPDGWVRLEHWKGGRIAVWNKDSEVISFQNAEALAFDYEGLMYKYDTVRCAQISTPDHKMPYMTKTGRWAVDTVENLAKRARTDIPFSGLRKQPSTMEHDLLRVLLMVQADGMYTDDGQVVLHFKKERKIQRCKRLLRRTGIAFVVSEQKKGLCRIGIPSRYVPLWLRVFKGKTFGYWLLNENADVIFDELPEWDGYRCGPNSIQYCTCNKANADLIQALAVMSGRSATILLKPSTNDKWANSYVVNIWLTPGRAHDIGKPTTLQFKGKVYCASTSTGFFVVRRNGRVWITGNSGRLFQPQNLVRPSLSNDEIEFAIELAKSGDALLETYDDPGMVLSQCLRGEIIAPKGKKLVVADYSNVEGRVLAWLAGEDWKIKAFKDYDEGHGHDLYKLTYGRVFNVKPEAVTKAQRQMGKVMELAMGYQGGAGAFVTFARGYGIDLDEMAKTVRKTMDPTIWAEAEDSYAFFAEKGLTHGLSKETFIACDAVKRAWRKANSKIAALWKAMDEGLVKALTSPNVVKVGEHLQLDRYGNYLRLRLPSGRYLCYPSPRLPEENNCTFNFMGVEQYSRKWTRIRTYAGKCVENATQAAACDLLCESLVRLEKAGYETVLTVHDEVIAEAPDTNEYSLARMSELMTTLPSWAKGLPLAAAGFEGYRYKKE